MCVWCELLNHHDLIVSGKSSQWCHLPPPLSLPLFSSSLCHYCDAKRLSCQSQAFVYRIIFRPIVSHHKEYGYNDTAAIVFLPAVGSRSSRKRHVVQILQVPSHHSSLCNCTTKLKTTHILLFGYIVRVSLLTYWTIHHGLPNRIWFLFTNIHMTLWPVFCPPVIVCPTKSTTHAFIHSTLPCEWRRHADTYSECVLVGVTAGLLTRLTVKILMQAGSAARALFALALNSWVNVSNYVG